MKFPDKQNIFHIAVGLLGCEYNELLLNSTLDKYNQINMAYIRPVHAIYPKMLHT